MPALTTIITGGQTGVDQAAWRAARVRGLATGGWMPRGFLTEEGPQPDFSDRFGAIEDDSDQPESRTIRNVRDADATLVFTGATPGPGTLLTIETARESGRPLRIVRLDDDSSLDDRTGTIVQWLAANEIRVLNVAGDRESHMPGIGEAVQAILDGVFEAVMAQSGMIRQDL